MPTLRIIHYGNPILRKKAEKVESIDDDVRQLVDDMVETMHVGEGIGLAATQVARSVSLFVIDLGLLEEGGKPVAIINPEIIAKEGESVVEEGCLSFPDIRFDVKRPETIRVTYMDLDGNEHEEQFGGLKARVFQHEIDHLNGVLFIDRIGPMKRKLLQKQLKSIRDNELTMLESEEV